jgi:hypothetical protein
MLDGSFYQPGTKAPTLMRARDGQFGNGELSIQLMRSEETDGFVPFVHGHPERPAVTEGLQDGGVHRPAVGHPGQIDAPEDGCRRTLDGTEFLQIIRPSETGGDRGSAHSTVTDLARLRG